MSKSKNIWPQFESAPSAVFFDVDGTLLPRTTSYLFLKRLLKKRLVSHSILASALYHGTQHHFGRLDYNQLIRAAANKLAHLPLNVLEENAKETFDDDVRPRLYQGVVDHAAELRDSGSPLILVSSSPELVLQPLAQHLGCQEILATPFVFENGRYVGIGDGPACHGEGKAVRVRAWSQKRGCQLDQAAAYADNWSDRWLLEIVGKPIVVHPRGKLKRMARRRGWLVLKPVRAE